MITHSIINCNCGCIPTKFYECHNCIDKFCKTCMNNNEDLCLFCNEQKIALDCLINFLEKNYTILDTLIYQVFKYHKYKEVLNELFLIINTIQNGNSIEINNEIFNYYTCSTEIYKLINVYYLKLMYIIKENI